MQLVSRLCDSQFCTMQNERGSTDKIKIGPVSVLRRRNDGHGLVGEAALH